MEFGAVVTKTIFVTRGVGDELTRRVVWGEKEVEWRGRKAEMEEEQLRQLAKEEDQTVKSTKTDGLFIHSERAEERERAAYWELKG